MLPYHVTFFVFMPISFARYSLDEWSVPTVQQSESLHP